TAALPAEVPAAGESAIGDHLSPPTVTKSNPAGVRTAAADGEENRSPPRRLSDPGADQPQHCTGAGKQGPSGGPGPVRAHARLFAFAHAGGFDMKSHFWNRIARLACSLWGPAPTRPTSRQRFRPALEGLEDRALLSTLTVLNLNDNGAGSLRGQLAQAE